MDAEFSEYSAPVGSIKTGRLIFTPAVSGVRLLACQNQGELYQARFRGLLPSPHLAGGMLTIQTSTSLFEDDRPPADTPLHICLNSAVSWELEFRGSVENLHADLRGIRLHALDILGDARQVELFLPVPRGAAFFYVSGAIRRAAIYRPAGVGMRLHVGGGMQKCSFDHQFLHAVRSETSLESTGFSAEDGYYDCTITGSAKSLTIAEIAREQQA